MVALPDDDADRSESLRPEVGAFAAAISTHGYCTERPRRSRREPDESPAALEPGGLLCADLRFGPRCALRQRPAASNRTFAPLDGDERGVAHTYFTRVQLEELSHPHYTIEACARKPASTTSPEHGRTASPARDAVHWFVVRRRLKRAIVRAPTEGDAGSTRLAYASMPPSRFRRARIHVPRERRRHVALRSPKWQITTTGIPDPESRRCAAEFRSSESGCESASARESHSVGVRTSRSANFLPSVAPRAQLVRRQLPISVLTSRSDLRSDSTHSRTGASACVRRRKRLASGDHRVLHRFAP